MEKLEMYSEFKQKKEKFDLKKIESVKDFNALFCEIKSQEYGKSIYRGAKSSKYKLYNTAQRHYWEKDINKSIKLEDFVEKQIKAAKELQNGLLEKYFKSFGLEITDIAVLSFLQHYGGKTQFMDWTYNFNIALFFGNYESNNEEKAEEYFSVYEIRKDKCGEELVMLSDIIDIAKTQLKGIKEEYPSANTNTVEHDLKSLSYQKIIKDFDLLLISDLEKNKLPLYSLTNYNIINQEGCFIFSNSSEKPLEEIFIDNSYLPKIKCYDINKELIKHIKKKINIEKSFVFPEPKKLARDAVNNVMI